MDKKMKTVVSRGLCGVCEKPVWAYHPVHAPRGQKRVVDDQSVYWHLACFIEKNLPTAPGEQQNRMLVHPLAPSQPAFSMKNEHST